MQNNLAHARLRAAEACLALRDAITTFCKPTATKKHQNEQSTREQFENKAKKCQEKCQSVRLYPLSFMSQ
jgi:hypothetical protein